MVSEDRAAAARAAAGFLSLAEMDALGATNAIFDPHSTLISRYASIGDGNTFYPSVVIECDDRSRCVVGSRNIFHSGSYLQAASGGVLELEDGISLGPGGVQVKANASGAEIRVGTGARLLNEPEIVGVTDIGAGAQVIGPIQVQNVTLGGGDTFTGPNPDDRGAVLKGFGLARGLRLATGDVVNGAGDFSGTPIERQAAYHPPKR